MTKKEERDLIEITRLGLIPEVARNETISVNIEVFVSAGKKDRMVDMVDVFLQKLEKEEIDYDLGLWIKDE